MDIVGSQHYILNVRGENREGLSDFVLQILSITFMFSFSCLCATSKLINAVCLKATKSKFSVLFASVLLLI